MGNLSQFWLARQLVFIFTLKQFQLDMKEHLKNGKQIIFESSQLNTVGAEQKAFQNCKNQEILFGMVGYTF